MTLLEGKKGVVLGIANRNSIAWAVTEALHGAGAELAFNYMNERMEPKVKKLTDTIPGALVECCDVTNDDEIDLFFDKVSEQFGGTLDFVIHSVAFADREDLEGRFVDTTRAGFAKALDISAYSLVAVTRRALPLFKAAGGGAVVTMSYHGARKVVQAYNVMGVAKASLEACVRYLAADLGADNVRVNALSAGPMNTLSARGLKGFTALLHHAADRSPLQRNITGKEIGDTTAYLVSDASSGVTGETLYVDAGYNIMGA